MIIPRSLRALAGGYANFVMPSVRRNRSERPATNRVLDYWRKAGIDRGYVVYDPKGKSNGQWGYLTDLCWKHEPVGRGKVWVELALESEWKRTWFELLRDFYKLLDIKARYKVFIFCAPHKDVDEHFDWLAGEIRKAKFNFPYEHYLLLCHSKNADGPLISAQYASANGHTQLNFSPSSPGGAN